jgi:hypothetical protein
LFYSGTAAPHHGTAINTPPDCDLTPETGHHASGLRKVKGSGGDALSGQS